MVAPCFIRHLPFPKPSELNRTVSSKLEEFIFKALSVASSDRWENIDDMLANLKVVRIAQASFEPIVALSVTGSEQGDWSSYTFKLIEDEKYVEAAQVAGAEFDSSKDYHALLAQFRALYRGGRYFEIVDVLNKNSECLLLNESLGGEFRELAVNTYLKNN